jgi:hypothetical protein
MTEEQTPYNTKKRGPGRPPGKERLPLAGGPTVSKFTLEMISVWTDQTGQSIGKVLDDLTIHAVNTGLFNK